MRIGITGIYASGKGTVSKMFAELGAIEIDTDIIARQVVEPGSIGLKKIINNFGNKYLNNDGTLKRRELAKDVFIDNDKTKILNNILHPLIREETLKQTSDNNNKIYIINTPLLFETNFHKIMNYTIVVKANINQVYDRGIKRDNLTKKEIKSRLKHQFSLNEKIKRADYIIDNSDSLENTKKQVLNLWKIITTI